MKNNHIGLSIVRLLLIGIAMWSVYFTYLQIRIKTPAVVSDLRTYTVNELRAYNGTEAGKPILLAYEGNVYDISAGRHYYLEGGPYHFLAGTDATTMLHIAGGGIVQKKYPIVGRLVL